MLPDSLSALLVAGASLLGAGQWQDEIERLVGHELVVTDTGYEIVDIAGEGPPLVGCVRRRDAHLYLETADRDLRLTGPLAVPRIAGPNYKVWILGTTQDKSLNAQRIGILAAPGKSTCPRDNQASTSHK